MELNKTYEDKVYAGVLGKVIGVYLGRPFEGWHYDRIMEELGPINYYVNDKLNFPLHVTDDDLTGTFRFINALKHFNYDKNITAKQIGQTWLNYCLENQTVLAWRGRGVLTEPTAYMNLKQGIHAPESGSIKLNGKIMAEQIGAQIFIDGFGLVSPGDPELAVELAKKAGSVSHDGESIYGAQVVAAIEAYSFIETDIRKIIEESKKFIPKESEIFKLISDIQNWSSGNIDWEQARIKIDEKYGYSKFPMNPHIVPNHALIILSLLFGDDNFQKSLMIANTAGWDTDCNSGNVGCILGIKNGLDGIKDGPDYISPVNDIIYLPTAYGGETMSDALIETQNIINIARGMNGLDLKKVKNNARYNFEMEESTQGWIVEQSHDNNLNTTISNSEFHSEIGTRALEVSFSNLSVGLSSEVYVESFFPKWFKNLKGYQVERYFHYDYVACPTVYSGQKIITEITSNSESNLNISLFIKYWGKDDELIKISSEYYNFQHNEKNLIEWTVPDTFTNPIAQLGISINSDKSNSGKIFINYLDIQGSPKITFTKPDHIEPPKRGELPKENYYGQLWKKAWVKDIEKWEFRTPHFTIVQGIGRGHIMIGTSSWKNYSVSSKLSVSVASAAGIMIRSQGLKRYYSLEISPQNKLKINKMEYEIKTLKEIDMNFEFFKEYDLKFVANNNKLEGYVDGKLMIKVEDNDNYFEHGMIGLMVENGSVRTDAIKVE